MTHSLIIDADPGIGDAIAVTAALLDPEIELVGLTSVAGRVSAEQAMKNLQAIVALLDPQRWPRTGQGEGEATPIPGSCQLSPEELDGRGGLGDFEAYDVETADRTEADKLLVDLVRASPNEITLLTLGPLTNVQRAVGRDPEFLSLLRGMICVGGSITVGGDVTPAAEFNFYADPNAARTVLKLPATTTLVPLDVLQRVRLTLDQYDRLRLESHTRRGRLIEQLLPFYFRTHHQQLGQESICLGELAALAAVTSPRFFEQERMLLDIETVGELTRGMAVFDRRGVAMYETNITVLTEVDAQGVIDRFAHVVHGK